MSHLTINKQEDYYPSGAEIFHRPGEPYITIDIDLNALPRETENIRIYLKSKTGKLVDAEIASSNECLVTHVYSEIISVEIGDAIPNPNAAKEIAEYDAKFKKIKKGPKSV